MSQTDMDEIVTPKPGVMSRRQKYSTDEQVVGQWIDGKPIYQKVYTYSSAQTFSARQWTNSNIPKSGIKKYC